MRVRTKNIAHQKLYVASEGLRREIHEGLQVVENWNSANSDLFYGKRGKLTGTDKENQEVSMLALHLMQSAVLVAREPVRGYRDRHDHPPRPRPGRLTN